MQQFIYGEGFLGKVRCDLDVFANGKVGDQVVELENEAKFTAAVFAQGFCGKRGDLAFPDADRAAIGPFKPTDEVKKR